MWKFYNLWIKLALMGAWGNIGFWTSIAGSISLIISHIFPHDAPYINSFEFNIFVGACFAVLITRLLLAPYWVYQENQKKLAAQALDIENFQKAWDRTGKYDITISQALERIAGYYSKTTLKDKPKDEIYKAAATKIRELGFENQITISGSEYNEDTKTFTDHSMPIPPRFWKKNGLDLDVIQNGIDQWSQTLQDGMVADGENRIQYGRIKMNGLTLQAMFPD